MTMKIIREFREFAIKGNVFDMAVGIIIGMAFNKVVSSLVNDILMPPVGFLIGKVSFNKLSWVLQEASTDEAGNILQEAVVVRYGAFIQIVLDFLIIALTVFLVIKAFNRLKRRAENEKDTTVTTPKDIALLSEIRDLLKK